MSEAPDLREQEDCPSNSICRGTCDQHSPVRPKHRMFHCDQCHEPALNIDAAGLCRACRVTSEARQV